MRSQRELPTMSIPRSQHRRVVITVAVFFITMVLLLVTQWPTSSRSSPVLFLDKYPRLKTGMTESQITQILGRPPRDYTSESHPGYILRGGPIGETRWWIGEECAVVVWFDSSGRASRIRELGPVLD